MTLLPMMDEVYNQPFLEKIFKQFEVLQEIVFSEVSKLNNLVP